MFNKALLFAAGFLLPFVAGEVVLQVWDPYHYGEKEDWTQYGSKIIDPHVHPNRLRAGAVASYLGKRTVISSQGWRSPEFVVPKPDGVFRVLLLGGSVPYGWGVADGEEYPRLLERQLNAAKLAGDRRIEVINAGVPGWRMAESGRFLLAEGLSYQPDMVFLSLVATDVPMKRNVQKRPEILNNSVRRLRLARAFENRFMFNTPGSKGRAFDAYADFDPHGLEAVRVMLAEFQKACRRASARFVVFDSLGREEIRSKCEQLGIHRVDGYTTWEQRRSWEVAATDAHPGAAGHRALAAMAFAGLNLKSLWQGR